MKSFQKGKLRNLTISNGLAALLARTAKEEGKEAILEKLEPALAESLKKSSIITSATTSCAIEGINVPETKVIAISDHRTQEAIDKEIAAPQVCLAAFILDFTCIHPIADGNGRVSRLLTTAALLELGLKMPKLVSLEEIIQDTEDQYYDALARSSEGWHTGNHRLEPFLRFHLETLATGYAELQENIQRIKEPIVAIFSEAIPRLDFEFRLAGSRAAVSPRMLPILEMGEVGMSGLADVSPIENPR